MPRPAAAKLEFIPFDAERPRSKREATPYPRPAPPKGALWVFGYGSLMWDPGFPFLEAAEARLWGYHRAFCVWSHHYRGTPKNPGLVLGLQPGGSVMGRAFRVAPLHAEAVIDYLYRREMLSGVYKPGFHEAEIKGKRCKVLCFVADTKHAQYAGGLSEARAARVIAGARGRRGRNAEYLANTVAHLDALGLGDGPLHRLLKRVLALGAKLGPA